MHFHRDLHKARDLAQPVRHLRERRLRGDLNLQAPDDINLAFPPHPSPNPQQAVDGDLHPLVRPPLDHFDGVMPCPGDLPSIGTKPCHPKGDSTARGKSALERRIVRMDGELPLCRVWM
jgi:hypothetical protein